jgi:serine/threonine protein kinase
MTWPTPQDYSEAVQNPNTNFDDPQLKSGRIALNPIGLPAVASGSFASVYRVICADANFALRCFLKDVPTQHERYQRVSKYVMSDTLPYTVDFNYLQRGILVRGKWYPVLKMDWVEGTTLDSYVRKHLASPERLIKIAELFRTMMKDLQDAGIAHGDLQHGNILITQNDELRLVDYDGMFVPELKGMPSTEIGHRNYQHPGRDGTIFNAKVDNFSAWSIYTSLQALSIEPSLAAKLNACDECLLFRQGDYRYPLSSRAFAELEQHSNEKLKHLSHVLRTLLAMPPDDIPYLSEDVKPVADLPPVMPDEFAPFAEAPVGRRPAHLRQAEADTHVRAVEEYGRKFPELSDYIASVSNPARNFIDPAMHDLIIARDHGSIRPRGTDHGAVFRFHKPTSSGGVRRFDTLVKVFLKGDELLEQRYKILHDYLHGGAPNYIDLQRHFAEFVFIPEGLRVNMKFYPIVRMIRITAPTLTEAVEAARHDRNSMRRLIWEFVQLMTLLQYSGIVHGDIEPENILVAQVMTVLDYDLTTTPLSRPLASKIEGNRHYRHPKLLPNQPVPNDNYAAWLLYYSMKIIAMYPQIWNIAGAKPGRLLFHIDDLKRPGTSRLFSLLHAHYNPEVRKIAEAVQELCRMPPEEVPPLRNKSTALQVIAKNLPAASSSVAPETWQLFRVMAATAAVVLSFLAFPPLLGFALLGVFVFVLFKLGQLRQRP